MKKLISAMLALALAAGMAACGENSDSSKAESKAASEKITDTSVSEPAKEAETTTTTTEPEKEEPSFFTADEEKIKSDLQENYDFLETAKLTIDNVTIDKRMTTEETKEDIVYITADFTGPMCKGTLKGQAKYLLFNEGWDYDSFESEEVTSELTKEPTIEDCRHIYEEVIKPLLDEEISAVDSYENLEESDGKYYWTLARDVDVNGDYRIGHYYQNSYITLKWYDNRCVWTIIPDYEYIDPNVNMDVVDKMIASNEKYYTADLVDIQENN